VAIVTLKKKSVLQRVVKLEESGVVNQSRYRSKTIPTAGAILKEEDSPNKQLGFDI
jgi:DNA gyrase subunit A